jgi:hypothetical protein
MDLTDMVAPICNGIGQVNSALFSGQVGRPKPLEGIAEVFNALNHRNDNCNPS